jgi:hypothetical protein
MSLTKVSLAGNNLFIPNHGESLVIDITAAGDGKLDNLFFSIASCIRARICKRLWSPGIDSEESTPPGYVVWRAGTTNRVAVPARQAGIDSWAP